MERRTESSAFATGLDGERRLALRRGDGERGVAEIRVHPELVQANLAYAD